MKKPAVTIGIVVFSVVSIVGFLIFKHKKETSIEYFLEKDMKLFIEAFEETEKHFDNYEEYTRSVDNFCKVADKIMFKRMIPVLAGKITANEYTELFGKMSRVQAIAGAHGTVWKLFREREPTYNFDALQIAVARIKYEQRKSELEKQLKILRAKYSK